MSLSIPECNVNQLIQKAEKSRVPLACDFEITFECNLKCVHCFHSTKLENENELKYSDICNIFDEIVEEGCLGITLTGGEGLLRNDFLDIYNYAYKKGLFITVFTNGTLITPEIADYFQTYPPHTIEISLYGITKETYENITRVSGSFEKCIHGIKYLIDRGLNVNLKTVALTLNVAEIEEMNKYATKLGLKFRVTTDIIPRFDFSQEPCKFRLNPNEAVKVMVMVHGYNILKEHSDECGGGKNSFHIDPYGNISICIPLREYNYNLLQVPFRYAWQNLVTTLRRARDTEKCLSCKMRTVCDQCPAYSYLETGFKNVPREFTCQYTRILYDLITNECPNSL